MFGTRSVSYAPWLSFGRQLDRLQGEFNRIFSDAPRYMESRFPACNIYANAEGAVLEAELPGVDIADIEITVSGNMLTIKGKRQETESESAKHIRRERRSGEFARTFELPFGIETAKVEAKSKMGVLRIELPRAESDKPKRIEVKIA